MEQSIQIPVPKTSTSIPGFVSPKKRRSILDWFRYGKDGAITGAADNDPAGIVTYTQAGASTGFSLLWLMALLVPMLYAVEEMSTRVSVVTKHGLNASIARFSGVKVALFVALIVAFANIATIGADLAGVGSVLELLSGFDAAFWVVAVGVIVAALLYKGSYAVVSRFLFLLTPLFLVYVGSAILAHPSWAQVLTQSFPPISSFSPTYLLVAVGVLGTTISPYLLFWQSTEEVEEKKRIQDLPRERKGVLSGMIYTQVIAGFVIIAAAATIFKHGVLIESATQAAQALRPLAGELSSLLFSIGIIVSGFLAIPILAASTGYVFADALRAPEGLTRTPKKAPVFYLVLFIALLVGIVMALTGIPAVKLLFYTQVLNGFLMPYLLFVLLRLSQNPQAVGSHRGSRAVRFFGWFTFAVFVIFDLLALVEWIR
jgi:Mn2+/Fe2+ NRAMP family transporter